MLRRADLRIVHKQMKVELELEELKDAEFSLVWWKHIETSNVVDLCRWKLFMAPLFFDVARAYLSIQASSPPAERLFEDAGYQEGTRVHATGSSVTEMLHTRPSHVARYLSKSTHQQGFLKRRGKSVRDLAEGIAKDIVHGNDKTIMGE